MFDQYALILHHKLDVTIMVPNEWPARAEPLLLNLVEKIIEKFNFSSPIVRINDIPTRLVRRHAPAGVYYVFNKVAKKEVIGAYVYDVMVPVNEEAIKLEITSGSTWTPTSWSSPSKPTQTHVDQIYRYLSAYYNLRRKALSLKDSNQHNCSHGHSWRKRMHRRKYNRECWDRFRYDVQLGSCAAWNHVPIQL